MYASKKGPEFCVDEIYVEGNLSSTTSNDTPCLLQEEQSAEGPGVTKTREGEPRGSLSRASSSAGVLRLYIQAATLQAKAL